MFLSHHDAVASERHNIQVYVAEGAWAAIQFGTDARVVRIVAIGIERAEVGRGPALKVEKHELPVHDRECHKLNSYSTGIAVLGRAMHASLGLTELRTRWMPKWAYRDRFGNFSNLRS